MCDCKGPGDLQNKDALKRLQNIAKKVKADVDEKEKTSTKNVKLKFLHLEVYNRTINLSFFIFLVQLHQMSS